MTWNASETADFYIVTAESSGGHKIQLSTNETSTFFSEFICGQAYFLSVQAVDSVCTSLPSQPLQLNSGRFQTKTKSLIPAFPDNIRTPPNGLPLTSSLPFLPLSEPCPPTDISSFMNCLSNIAVVSWTGSAGADFYTATVMQEDGQSTSCWSDSEQCGMPNVPCGKNYTVMVVASNDMCNSDPSEAGTLQSG